MLTEGQLAPQPYATPTAHVLGYYRPGDATQPMYVDITVEKFADVAAAEAFLAQLFPKSIRARATHCSKLHLPSLASSAADSWSEYWGQIVVTVKLGADGVNGGRNETGIKRLRTAMARIEAAGIPTLPYWRAGRGMASNQYATVAELMAAIDAS